MLVRQQVNRSEVNRVERNNGVFVRLLTDELLELILEDLDGLLVLLQDARGVHLLVLLDAVKHSELDIPSHFFADVSLLLYLIQLNQGLACVFIDIPCDRRELVDLSALNHFDLFVVDFQDVSMG